MKRILSLLICIFLLSAFSISAQVYGCYYFIKSGTYLSETTDVTIVYFSGRECAYETKTAAEVSEKLSSNSSYWENYLKKECSRRRNDDAVIKYDSSLSTSKYTVYKGESYGPQQYVQTGQFSYGWIQPKDGGHYFVAISKDKQSLILWRESAGSTIPSDKRYYERVNERRLKVDLHDFLK